MRTQPKIIFDMLEGYAPVKNLLGMADPNVHKIDGQWWMFFGAMQRNFTNNLFWATLPKGEPLNADMQWQITMDPTNPKKAQSLTRQPSKGEWDHFGLHEPCFVEGKKRDDAGKWVPSRRIYYTGRTGRSLFGKNTKYSIGLLELTANGWQRHGAPVITSDVLSHCALAPKVIYDDDEKKWRIWYLADAREPVKGDKDAADIYYSESDDGIIWQAPKSFFGNEYKFTHAHVHRRGDGTYEMLLSKMASFSGEASYHEHKLWISTAETPSGHRSDWSELQEVIVAKGGKVWYANGFFGSSVCEADAKGEEGEQYIFFTGIRGSFNWLKIAVKRLMKLKKPPNLAPFYFAIGFFKTW
jgi:hypothetical protein